MLRLLTALTCVLSTAVAAPAALALDPPPSVPKASCGAGSLPEPGMQGRVAKADLDSGAAAAGYHCNMTVVGHTGETGGFKVLRYVDKTGRECAYYDTTLLFPTNTLNLSLQPTGVAVLDMSDPAHPRRVTTLVTPAMQTPHESLNISTARGVLAAVMGNPSVAPGQVDVYDISQDCTRPQLESSAPVGYLGHESGMAPDGKTFYANSLNTGGTTAVDISNPARPVTLGNWATDSHGMTVSDDGRRGYMASLDGLRIYDLTQVQDRKGSPQLPLISKLTWPTMTIPQVAHPFTRNGHPYLAEVDEYSTDEGGGYTANGPRVGAARIIDIGDERHPQVVSDIRLEVHQPKNRAAIAADYGARNPTQGYAGHYCNIPSRVDPQIMACSMILSGLRVFDISDPAHPREIAYFVAPPDRVSLTGGPVIDERADWAMSQPAFVPARHEIWYSDGTSGFWALRLDPSLWDAGTAGAQQPLTDDGAQPTRRRSTCRQRVRLTLPRLHGRRIVRAVATRGGRRLGSRRGRSLRSLVVRRPARTGTVRVRVTTRDAHGRTRSATLKRRVRACPA